MLHGDARNVDVGAPRGWGTGSAFGHEGATEPKRSARVDVEVHVDVVDADFADLDLEITLAEEKRLCGGECRDVDPHPIHPNDPYALRIHDLNARTAQARQSEMIDIFNDDLPGERRVEDRIDLADGEAPNREKIDAQDDGQDRYGDSPTVVGSLSAGGADQIGGR